MRGWSVFGCGVMQLGLRRGREGGLETTRWVTLCYLPVLPLSRWRVRYAGLPLPQSLEDESFAFEPLGRLPLSAGGVLRTAWCGWCLVALAVGPALACAFGIQGAANNFEMALAFASCCWPLLVLLAVQRRRRVFVRRKAPPAIRTVDDLTAALRSDAIRPHVYRDGEQQVADLFAETGLSPLERKKVLLRSFGYPAGIRMYVHRACAGPYLEQLPAQRRAVFEPHTEQWSPADLLGRFRDVTHCDHCRREFLPTDDGYVAYWVVPREELRLLEEVQREQSSSRQAEPGAAPDRGGRT
jgi:hypothetical protein